MSKANNNSMIFVLAALCLLLGGVIGAVAFSEQTEIEVPFVVEKIVASNCSAAPDFVLSQDEFEQNVEEAKALELALDSVESRDFNKAVFDALVSFGESIDSYKDITDIKYEVEVDGDEVEFSKIRVYYFIDEDEEEDFKSLFNDFIVDIDDLDFDDLSDAEVDENYLGNLLINKVY